MPPPAAPAWFRTFADKHLKANIVAFILHGHIDDWVPTQAPGTPPVRYLSLPDYLLQVVLQPRQFVAKYNPARGLEWRTQPMQEAFRQSVAQFDAAHRTSFANRLPTEPTHVFALLEHFFRMQLLAGKGVGLVVEEAEKLAPAGNPDAQQQALLNTLITFSRDKLFTNNNFVVLLLAQSASALHNQLLQNTHAFKLDVLPPDEAERMAFIEHKIAQNPATEALVEGGVAALARNTLGLSLMQIGHLLDAAREARTPLSFAQVNLAKRSLRAAMAGGLLCEISPEHVPAWAEELARLHATRTVTQFIIHGNIVDYVKHVNLAGETSYLRLREYLFSVIFKNRPIVATFDRANGIGFRDEKNRNDFFEEFFFKSYFKSNRQSFENWLQRLNNAQLAFKSLEQYFEARLQQGHKIAFIIEYAETLVPMGPGGNLAADDRSMLVFLQKWAKTGQFLNADITTVLLTENVNDIHQSLVRNPFTHEVEILHPDADARRAYINHHRSHHPTLEGHLEMSLEVLARDTAGLTIVQVRTLLAEIMEGGVVFTFNELTQRKKDIIESEAGGLLAFVETRFTLDNVAGHRHAKQHLRDAAKALKSGRGDVLPMGYLVNGPVGTGKTFLVSCFAAEIGIPMVELKNFRSQYVGVTEANLEKVLRLLKAMNPVAVLIDEADATLGNRGQGGDSGVSSRVFSMIASFMSNTEHRGKIIWFLLTARPDLMPIDLKRQGRAEEHIALFYPETLDEKRELLHVMLRKTGIQNLTVNDFPDSFFDSNTSYSGADMEAALTRAKFRAAALGLPAPSLDVVKETFADFIPPTYPEEVELMNLVAVLECTSRELLPERFRNMPRHEILDRLEALRRRVPR